MADPKGENTVGQNADGTPAIGTPEQMRPLLEQWKRFQEMMERGEIPTEPILSVQPVAKPEQSDEDADADEEVDDLDVHYG